MTTLSVLLNLALVAYILYTRREAIERTALKFIVPKLSVVPSILIDLIWKHSLIVDKSSSCCGSCGYGGGYMSPHHTSYDLVRCDGCGIRWMFGWLTYESGWGLVGPDQIQEDAQNTAIVAENLGVRLLGCGSGNLVFGEPRIHRLYDQSKINAVLAQSVNQF